MQGWALEMKGQLEPEKMIRKQVPPSLSREVLPYTWVSSTLNGQGNRGSERSRDWPWNAKPQTLYLVTAHPSILTPLSK
jgi:hypothetical protein